MKSVGEVMAIGRNFHQSFQKALRSLETGLDGLDEIKILMKIKKILFFLNYLLLLQIEFYIWASN